MHRQLGEQLQYLARRATTLAAENPGWIAPSQVAVAQRLAEAAIVLQSHAEVILRQRYDE
jgi:replication-associated recombination protein RarA